MASIISKSAPGSLSEQDYPTSDGQPMGETDLHRSVMLDTIETLKAYFAGKLVYVTGNLLLFYEEGNRRRHVSPDCMVVKGLEQRDRKNFLLWKEGSAPSIVIEITSASTRDEDLEDKMRIYRDEICVAEYFLFDPWQEYLTPQLQGHRLTGGLYVPIEPVAGRLPSMELGLELEAAGAQLRFFNAASSQWLPTPKEALEQAEADNLRLRQKVEELERKLNRGND
ncbi:MAG TPA: Uma2 family endonuclease [Pirellulaceae bacterium]|nr:Uma2 family endonuclease [Pirellulaceae bacterium]